MTTMWAGHRYPADLDEHGYATGRTVDLRRHLKRDHDTDVAPVTSPGQCAFLHGQSHAACGPHTEAWPDTCEPEKQQEQRGHAASGNPR